MLKRKIPNTPASGALKRPNGFWEEQRNDRCGGVDEVGYGAWAGPIVVAAAWIDLKRACPKFLQSLQDSKRLTQKQRATIMETVAALRHSAKEPWVTWAIARQEVDCLHTENPLQKTLAAMAEAAQALNLERILVDGPRKIPISIDQVPIKKGDGESFSIALASVIAKVTRDEEMKRLHLQMPLYHWDQNKGYGTASHQNAIKQHGLSPHHRLKYCKNFINKMQISAHYTQ